MITYAIEPQRDMWCPDPAHSDDSDETWFVRCGPEDAEQWAVFALGGADPEYVADFATREEAVAHVAELGGRLDADSAAQGES